jgi:L-ascorbate metabolism protein UlaG (beta-lactamase superfamily)
MEGSVMRITKYGHACLLLEEGSARILIDPGAFSKGFEGLTGLDAVLITHQHMDHVQVGTLKPLLAKNAGAKLYADEDTAGILAKEGIEAQAVHEGDELDVAGVKVAVVGHSHAVIHPDIPGITNVGYLVAGRFYYPGDSLVEPPSPVEILALPLVAPWEKVSETVDFARAVAAKVAIPVHDGITAAPQIYTGAVERLVKGTKLKVLVPGQVVEL